MAAEGRLLFHISEFERKLDLATKKSAEASSKVKQESRGMGEALSDGFKSAAMGGLGAVGVGLGVAELAGTIREATAEANRLRNIGQSLNEPVEALQRLQFAAGKLGIDFETATEFSRELEDKLGDLGNTEPVEVLARMGLNARDLIGVPIDQKLLMMAEAFQRSRAEGVGYSDLLKLVGDSAGEQLLPLLTQSKESLEAMFSEAPVLADGMIDRMAELNGEFEAMTMKSKAWIAGTVGAFAELGRLGKDIFTTGSIEEAMIRMADRDTAATQRKLGMADINSAKAEAIEAARAAEQEAKAREKSAGESKKAADELAKIKEAVAKSDFEMLPDEAKVTALKQKLGDMLKETVGMFSLNFDTSIEGLEKLAKSREEMGDKLPETGQNSAAEAWAWLQEAKQLSRDRSELEKHIAEKEKSAAEAKAKELEGLREKAEEGDFQLMDPEQQARHLTEKLSKSFGFNITGVEDVERGLDAARQRVKEAREAGDGDAEKAALENLAKAQGMARDLAGMAAGEDAEDAVVNGRGSVAGAIANIFGRSSADLQLDEAKQQTTLLGNIEMVLTKIWETDSKPVTGDPPFTYP